MNENRDQISGEDRGPQTPKMLTSEPFLSLGRLVLSSAQTCSQPCHSSSGDSVAVSLSPRSFSFLAETPSPA